MKKISVLILALFSMIFSSELNLKNMVLVNGGSFEVESNNYSDAKPVHTTRVNSFYIGKYEVTVKEFKKFIDATDYKTDAEKNGYSWVYNESWKRWEKKDGVTWKCNAKGNTRSSLEYNHPAIHVSWNDAASYCKWLSRQTGENYRLPTEIEWDYAAHGGKKSRNYKYSGSDSIDEVAWYWENSINSDNGISQGRGTYPVGQKKPNELGLYDMSGNVWEWCEDFYDDAYPSSRSKANDTMVSSYRVVRGGSWNGDAQSSLVTSRYLGDPQSSDCHRGFRIVKSK